MLWEKATRLHARRLMIGLHVLLAAWMALGTASAVAAGSIGVEGSKVAWTGTLPSGWVGGHARQMERIIEEADDENLRTIMNEMLLDAQELDVYFIHLDVTAVKTQTLSELRVNVLPEPLSLGEKASRAQVWQRFAQLLQGDAPPGSKTTVVQDTPTSTGGHPAYQAVFQTVQPDGGTIYTVMHVVDLPDGRAHLFQLTADSKKFEARQADLQGLLSSVRY